MLLDTGVRWYAAKLRQSPCHPGAGLVAPAQAGVQCFDWMPAYAGMTTWVPAFAGKTMGAPV